MSEPGANAQSAHGSGIAQAASGGVATVNITQVYQVAGPAAIAPQEMAAATRRLQELPLDLVPAPAGLPTGSWMPLRRNALFVGREADLGTLASALKEGGTAAVGQSTAVTGLGGIGKSQLASEFAYRYGQYFVGGVFWLGCDDPNAIPAEIATCGRNLNLHADFTNLPLDRQVSLVASAWHGELPRLLIFDNCEDEKVLETWLPRGGGCRVLATSRRNTWSLHLGVREVSLGVLARSESLALLRKHRPDLAPDEPLLDAIAAELGDLPLALHLAGSYLARYRQVPFGQPAAYLQAVRQPDLLAHRSFKIEGASATGHEQDVARSFALSYEQLRPADAVDATAQVTLARAAWFAPGEPIPRALLRASAGVDGADEPAALRFEDGLARLRELSLITEQETGALVLHRLLATFVRSAAGDSETHRGGVEAAVVAEVKRLNAAGYPAPLLAWQPQLRFVADHAAEAGSRHAAVLLNELGFHLRMVADFAGAKAAYERAHRIDEASFGPFHPNVAIYLSNLGLVLQDLGDLARARAAFERALPIFEKQLEPEHPNVATLVSNLGSVLQKLGDLPGARVASDRALRIDEASFGPDHPTVATRVNNLGSVLQDLGDLVGARAAFERALPIFEKQLGPEHPNVATLVNNLGRVLLDLGDLAGARAAFERALGIDEVSFGQGHPNVAIRVNNLANVLRNLGDLAGARAAFERALKIGEASFGPDHPQVATYVHNLGSVLWDLGDLAGARAALERAQRIDEASFGADHPNVARDVNSLGSVLQSLGDLAGARAAFERGLPILERALGLEHPNVALALNNLGGVLLGLGDLAGARAAFKRALKIDEASFGQGHPNVARDINNLGGVLLVLRDLAGARTAFKRALGIDEASFGPDHPNVARDINNLGGVLKRLGDLAGARAAFERALSIFEHVLGPEHPSTRNARGNLERLGGG